MLLDVNIQVFGKLTFSKRLTRVRHYQYFLVLKLRIFLAYILFDHIQASRYNIQILLYWYLKKTISSTISVLVYCSISWALISNIAMGVFIMNLSAEQVIMLDFVVLNEKSRVEVLELILCFPLISVTYLHIANSRASLYFQIYLTSLFVFLTMCDLNSDVLL